MGGFSEGALRAGYDHIVAVDCWDRALALHHLNHPTVKCVKLELGKDISETWATITEHLEGYDPTEDHLHVHASPPCQNLSIANVGRDHDAGMSLVSWAFAFIMEVQRFNQTITWSLEQVYNRLIVEYAQRIKNQSLMPIYFSRCDMSLYGVPQKRHRFVAASKDVFSLMERSFSPMSSHIQPPVGTSYLGNTFCNKVKMERTGYSDHIKAYVPGETLSYTITAKCMYFISSKLKVIRSFTIEENAAIQTFCHESIENFKQWKPKSEVLTMIGNSVPPLFAERLLKSYFHSRD